MKTYELTYIISSQISSEESNNVAKDIESSIQDKGGVIVKSGRPAIQTLAYIIKKQSSGYFVTLEFQFEETKVKELVEKLEKDKSLLRQFLMVKRPAKISKPRRTRKPLLADEEPSIKKDSFIKSKEEKPKKVDAIDLDKKLDEILSE